MPIIPDNLLRVLLARPLYLNLWTEIHEGGFTEPPAESGYKPLTLEADAWEIANGLATTKQLQRFRFTGRAGLVRGYALSCVRDGQVHLLSSALLPGGAQAIHRSGDVILFKPEIEVIAADRGSANADGD